MPEARKTNLLDDGVDRYFGLRQRNRHFHIAGFHQCFGHSANPGAAHHNLALVWMPVNFLLYTALMRLGAYYGDTFKVECPTGSGQQMTLFEVAKVLGERLIGTFVKDSFGKRPVFGDAEKFQTDPYWRDNLLFFEYFHGDTGAGVGASHQTGWTGCIARVIQANGAFSEELLGEHDIETRAIRLGQGMSAEADATAITK